MDERWGWTIDTAVVNGQIAPENILIRMSVPDPVENLDDSGIMSDVGNATDTAMEVDDEVEADELTDDGDSSDDELDSDDEM